MGRYKILLDKFDWKEIDADTNEETGERLYATPDGPAPSVTTILSTLPKPELDEWRERVGEEEANRVSKEATTIGTYMHDMLEADLLGNDFPYDGSELEAIAKPMAAVIKKQGFRELNEVWCVEIPLHFKNLYAGRTDLVGLYRRHPHIMDYKTAKYIKPEDQLEHYRMQMAAYGLAMEHMFGMKFEHAVNFFAIRPNPEYKQFAKSYIAAMDPPMMQKYKIKWIETLVGFYETYDPTRLDQIDELIMLVE